jgi:uncharacterized protein YndB with AHSA1/START domain/predicted enzyme related to lactoylglutathione lyase
MQTTLPALVIRRILPASPERVYQAWTKPSLATEFICPEGVTVEHVALDVRVGGAYHIAMRVSNGEVWTVRGVYQDVQPGKRLSMTWKWDEDDPADEQETLLTLDFAPHGRGTELTLTHERFASEESRSSHEQGWNSMLDKMQALQDRAVRVKGIDLSGYMVKDAQRAIAFYRDVLALEPARVYPENRGAEYDLPDGTTFGLWGGGGKVMPFQPSNGILFAVDDLDAAVDAVKEHGVQILMQNETPNCRMAMFADSEGNSVFLHQRKKQ